MPQSHRDQFVFIVSFARAPLLVFWLPSLFVSVTVYIARVEGQFLPVLFIASVSVSLWDRGASWAVLIAPSSLSLVLFAGQLLFLSVLVCCVVFARSTLL